MSLTRARRRLRAAGRRAPLIIAREIGFAAEEGLDLVLHREASWAALRDKLVWEQYQAAHMLSPVPIALSAGLGGPAVAVDALSVLSVNGEMIGVRSDLAERMGAGRWISSTPAPSGAALLADGGGALRIGVPFPFSMHCGAGAATGCESLGAEATRRARGPHRSAAADGRCDGARARSTPSASASPGAASRWRWGVAELILPGAAIWRFAPDKVLAARRDWVEAHPDTAAALMRAVWRAGRWAAERGNIITVAEILGRAGYLDVSPEIIERPLRGRLVVNAPGRRAAGRRVASSSSRGAATFPWRSQAVWIADALARRTGQDRAPAARGGAGVLPQRPLSRDPGSDRGGPAWGLGEAGGCLAASHGGRLDDGQADARAGSVLRSPGF